MSDAGGSGPTHGAAGTSGAGTSGAGASGTGSPSPVVKICGITREADALAAVAAGADRIGFVFADSPRSVSIECAASIARALPTSVEPVGVFVNPDPADVARAFEAGAIRRAQFHGDETPGNCRAFGRPFTRAVRIREPGDVEHAVAGHDPSGAEELLLDPFVEGQAGGTGRTLGDEILAALAVLRGVRLFLAGGLDASNVEDRLARIAATPGGSLPYGVDASSRLETAPGEKDAGAVRDFVAASRAAFASLATAHGPRGASDAGADPENTTRTHDARGSR